MINIFLSSFYLHFITQYSQSMLCTHFKKWKCDVHIWNMKSECEIRVGENPYFYLTKKYQLYKSKFGNYRDIKIWGLLCKKFIHLIWPSWCVKILYGLLFKYQIINRCSVSFNFFFLSLWFWDCLFSFHYLTCDFMNKLCIYWNQISDPWSAMCNWLGNFDAYWCYNSKVHEGIQIRRPCMVLPSCHLSNLSLYHWTRWMGSWS